MSDSPHTPSPSRLPKWFKVVTISFLVAANIAVLGWIWLVQTGGKVLEEASTDSEVAEALDEPSSDATSLTFLIVGSDSRAGLDDLTHFSNVGGARGDVVMLVRLDADGSTAQMLSVPRDLLVEIPGHSPNRVNAAYAFGGPALLVDTLKRNLNVEINHYVEIDFAGFQSMVDELGGIEIAFPYAARDLQSGLNVDAGSQHLDGAQALAYARSRKYQELQNGSWVSVRANDIGRTERQQEVIRAMLAELRNPSSITEAGNIASALGSHMTIDTNLANASVSSMFWDFKGILAGTIEGATLPVRSATVDGRSVLVMNEPGASEMLANFRGGAPLASQPLRVQVLNGNGTAGSATAMARTLESLGFVVANIGNSGLDSYLDTTIVIREGSETGDLIKESLGFGVVEVGFVDNSYDALVIVGDDAQ